MAEIIQCEASRCQRDRRVFGGRHARVTASFSALVESTERFASRREIADLRRALRCSSVKYVEYSPSSRLRPPRNCAISLGPANRSVL
jgi:hypothetical protein